LVQRWSFRQRRRARHRYQESVDKNGIETKVPAFLTNPCLAIIMRDRE